jgi:gas vesicle protein
MRSFFSFLAGSVMGAAVGAAMALLLTPYSGEELRELASEAAYAKREQMEARIRELQATHKKGRPAPAEEV